jgi:hypothetical protein
VDTYSVQPVFYKMTEVTYDVNGCLIVLTAVSAGHISKWRVHALCYNSRLSAVKCKSRDVSCRPPYCWWCVSLVFHFLVCQYPETTCFTVLPPYPHATYSESHVQTCPHRCGRRFSLLANFHGCCFDCGVAL